MAATLLLQQGVAARVALELLGHSQISMTMHYSHAVPELATEAAARIESAPWGPTPAGPPPRGGRSGARRSGSSSAAMVRRRVEIKTVASDTTPRGR